MASKGKVIVVGDGWPGLLVAFDLMKAGVDTTVFKSPPALTPTPEWEPIFLGNGDPKARVLATMGIELGEKLYRISEINLKKANSLFKEQKIPVNPAGLLRETGPTEEGAVFSSARLQLMLEAALAKKLRPVDRVVQVEVTPQKNYAVAASVGGELVRKTADVVVVISEYLIPTLFHSFHEKLIPVTLHSFEYASVPKVDFAVGLFHGGADYALMGTDKALYGSYRNLFEDKGVGLIKDADPKTKTGVETFFGSKSWLQGEGQLRCSVESVSCDGLPIVGATSEMPGVYVVAGFAARKANFIFQVSDYLARGISKGGWSDDVEAFSTKRFV